MKTKELVKEFLNRCTEYESEFSEKGLTSKEAMEFIADRFNEVFHAPIICKTDEDSEEISIHPYFENMEFADLANFITKIGIKKESEVLVRFIDDYLNNHKDLSDILSFGFERFSSQFRMYQLEHLYDDDKEMIQKLPCLPSIYRMFGGFYSLRQFRNKLRTILTFEEVENLVKKDDNFGALCDEIRDRFSKWIFDIFDFNNFHKEEIYKENIKKVNEFISDIDTDSTIEFMYDEKSVSSIMDDVYCIDF